MWAPWLAAVDSDLWDENHYGSRALNSRTQIHVSRNSVETADLESLEMGVYSK